MLTSLEPYHSGKIRRVVLKEKNQAYKGIGGKMKKRKEMLELLKSMKKANEWMLESWKRVMEKKLTEYANLVRKIGKKENEKRK